jgi:hypothetical protein
MMSNIFSRCNARALLLVFLQIYKILCPSQNLQNYIDVIIWNGGTLATIV